MDDRVRTLSLATYRTLRISLPTVLESVVNRVTREACDARIAWWSRTLLDDVGVTITLRGAEHLAPQEPMMVMSNHQSLYDIPVLFQTIPGSLRMVSKVEIGWVPIWGSAMRASDFIFIDRKNRESAIRSLRTARERLDRGVTIWIAPEGTRSRDGALGPFKKGGFVLAQELNVPILPVTIDGTHKILPAKTTDIRTGVAVTVTIHPRVHPADVPDRDALMARVRDAIASSLTPTAP